MDTQIQIDNLRRELQELTEEVYRGNFTSQQDFTKYSNFTSKIKIPVVTALPATCEIGELVSYNAKLYHASALNTWTAQT